MRFRRKGALAGVAAASALWMLTGAAGAADGGIQCGSVITEDTVLTHDLLDCEDGLVISAPNVTLDLGGHQIVGRGAGTGVNVLMDEQAAGSVVRNGTIRSFSRGVFIGQPTTMASHLDVSSNEVGLVLFAKSVTVEQNTVHHNGVGVWIQCCARPFEPDIIVGNKILSNAQEGIRARRGESVRIENNLVMKNGGDGVSLFETYGVVLNNTFKNNGGAGLKIEDGCFFWQFIYRVGGNDASGNGQLGIDVWGGDLQLFRQTCGPDTEFVKYPADLDAGGNSARKNGDARQCLGVVCAPKPS